MPEVRDYPFAVAGALEPDAEWQELRARCPVAHVRLPSGDEARVVTRYDDVRAVLSDPRFTRRLGDGGARLGTNEGGTVFEQEDATGMTESVERHQAFRRMLAATFTAKRVQALEPAVRAKAVELVDAMLAGGGPADLTASLGFPLPVWVICELLGVPDEDRARFAHWSDTTLTLTRYTQEEVDQAKAEFDAYMLALVERKRAEPADDLMSALVAILDANDPRMTGPALIQTGQGLLVAGHETTANMIGKMVAMLLDDRSRWEAVVADPALIRTAVEEALRYDANPNFGIPRLILEDAEIGGELVPAGTTVICSIGAANRDERAFEGADEFVIDRAPNAHVMFGAGAHSCLGQSLARTELQIVLSVLVEKVPSLRLAVPAAELRRREGLIVGGLVDVPVEW